MYENNDDFIPLQVPGNEDSEPAPALSEPIEDSSISQSRPAVRNVKDLVNTLARMNKRLVELEEENKNLQVELKSKADKREVVKMIANTEALSPPKHGLTADSFIVRAVSIYGHWFVANLVVSIVFGIIFGILFATVLNGIATNLINSGL